MLIKKFSCLGCSRRGGTGRAGTCPSKEGEWLGKSFLFGGGRSGPLPSGYFSLIKLILGKGWQNAEFPVVQNLNGNQLTFRFVRKDQILRPSRRTIKEAFLARPFGRSKDEAFANRALVRVKGRKLVVIIIILK